MGTELNLFVTGLSPQRLGPYLKRSDGDQRLAVSHYLWNLKLSEALYPVLHLNEVVFRNALHQTLTVEFKTETWFEEDWLYESEKRSVEEVIKEIRKQKRDVTADRVIAQLTFGFWCSLCNKRYEHRQTLWPKLLRHKPLKQLPKSLRQRQSISKVVECLRRLRNRVFHHEPIWHWKDLPQRHKNAVQFLQWLNPEAARILQHTDRFTEIYQQGTADVIQELYS